MNEYKKNVIGQAIDARMNAIAVYEIDIFNFETTANRIGEDWPAEIAKYKGVDKGQVPGEVLYAVLEREAHDNFRDDILERAVKTRIELSRETLILQALQDQLKSLQE